jgi:catechol 2,3-dioxygenase-like lactoylglutathione lyase family enzyme
MSDIDITIHTTFLPHTDPEATLGFYRDLLGFELVQDVGQGAMRWLTFVSPAQPDVRLVLTPPAADPGVTEDERRTITELMAKGSYQSIILGTKDLDGVFARLQAADAEVVSEPTEQPWGVRDCAFRDPAGNMVRIDQVG